MACPEENVLVDFVRGELSKPQRSELEAHLDECDACSMVVAQMACLFADDASEFSAEHDPPSSPSVRSKPSAASSSKVAADSGNEGWSPRLDTDGAFTPTAVTEPSGNILTEPAAQLPQGAKLGRYVVIDRVGAGGMGVVYAAYDPELDRKVALKVLRSGSLLEGSTSRGGKQRDRLMREAQAMAKLSHPNVITVHDVGTFEDRVFLAMEFIDGCTLGEWMKQRKHSWSEVVEVMVAAGRGLAAAHAIDLVHRDFKPDNVLIGNDGRILVTDFGLARPAAGKTGSFSAIGEIPSQQVLTASLTQTGALVGTPAYMAPEQLSGSRTSPLTDQFSFCVALYEGLYGTRPFRGSSFAELASNLVSGVFSPPPRDVTVPRRVRRALFRGLATDPDARFASMDALLTELGQDPWGGWRRFAAVLVPAGIAVTAGSLYLGSQSEVRYCENVDEQLEGIWDDDRRETMATAFGATQAAFADDALQSSRKALDTYADQWAQMQGEACRDQINGEQPQAVLALRMYCLDRRRASLRAVADLMTEADIDVVKGAVDATRGLPDLEPCDDLDALTQSLPPPPEDLNTRAAVEEIERKIASARALREAGKYDETENLARSALAEAKQVGYGPAEAEALTVLATTVERKGQFDDAEDLYHRAMSTALAAGHGRVIAEASVGLVWLTSEPDRPLRESERWAEHGLGALAPTGGQAELQAQLHHATAVARMNHGEFESAQASLDKVVEIREAAFGPGHHSLGAAMSSQGRLMAMTNRLEEAIEAFRSSRRHVEHEYGAHHPYTATVVDNLAVSLSQHGDYAEARALQLQALEIREATLGSNHPEVAWSHLNMAATLDALEQYEEANAHAMKAHEVFIDVFGPRSLEVTSSLTNLASSEHSMGQLELALERRQLALELATEHLGPDHAKVGKYHHNLAGILVDMHRGRLALEHYEAALEITEAARGPEDTLVAQITAGMANLFTTQMDRADDAVGLAERAVRIAALHPGRDELRGLARFALAQALWESPTHRDRVRARSMGELALPDLQRGHATAEAIASAKTWLREHPL